MLPGCPAAPATLGKPDAVEIALLTNKRGDPGRHRQHPLWLPTPTTSRCFFVDQETQTPFLSDDATIIVDGQQTDEEALVAQAISCRSRATASCWKSYPGRVPRHHKGRGSLKSGQPCRCRAVRADIVDTVFAAPIRRPSTRRRPRLQKRIRPTPRSSRIPTSLTAVANEDSQTSVPRLMGLPPTEAVR